MAGASWSHPQSMKYSPFVLNMEPRKMDIPTYPIISKQNIFQSHDFGFHVKFRASSDNVVVCISEKTDGVGVVSQKTW
jgi:hypothetical protein